MISITVHHHNQNPHGPLTVGAACSAAVAPTKVASNQTISASSSNSSSSSSNVQVQYLARTYFRTQDQQQPSKILGALQDLNCQQESCDLNNNNDFMSLHKEMNENENIEISAAAPAAAASASTSRRPMKLHSRSISLVINPEFNSDSDFSCPTEPLVRRRSLPRLKRRTHHLRQAHQKLSRNDVEKNRVTNMQQPQQVVNAPTGSQQGSTIASTTDDKIINHQWNDGTQLNHDEELRLRCSVSVPEFSTETIMTRMQTTITTTTTTADSTNSATPSGDPFRQAGILLREISDEFARCRRRTI